MNKALAIILPSLAVLVVAGFAGCVEEGNVGGEIEPTFSASASRLSTSKGLVLPTLRLDSCATGIASLAEANPLLFPAAPPPGWEPKSLPRYTVQLFILQCDRISIDHFERGPVHFLMEGHSNISAPDACLEGDFTPSERVLGQLWLDDAEVATHLRTTYGLPAQFAEIILEESEMGGARQFTWRFNLPGGEESTLVTHQTTPNDQTEYPTFRHFFVNHLGGISYIDAAENVRSSGKDPHGIIESLRPPFIRATETPAPGYGLPLFDGHVSAAIHQFRDMQCEEPL